MRTATSNGLCWPTSGLGPIRLVSAFATGGLAVDVRALPTSLRIIRAKPPMLEQFARLAEPQRDPDRAVQRYARRWGLLDLCEHQLPADHETSQLPIAFATTGGAVLTFPLSTDCRSLPARPCGCAAPRLGAPDVFDARPQLV